MMFKTLSNAFSNATIFCISELLLVREINSKRPSGYQIVLIPFRIISRLSSNKSIKRERPMGDVKIQS